MNAVPSVNHTLVLLSSHTQACLASPKIRTALGKRLEGAPGEEILQLLQSWDPCNVEELRKCEAHLPPEDSGSHSNEPFGFDPDSMASALDRLLDMSGAKDEELDSDDLDDVDEAVDGPTGLRGDEGAEASEGLRKYMDEMDHELMGTSMGQSFNQQGTNKAGPACNGCPRSPSGEGLLGEDEEIQPLDIDLNMVTNLLESLSSRAGRAGL
uniref:protein ecdysoneless homolog isoform X2 n=1 Tax=Oncorhynchus gorbuscha TaxID=8017 RepID=UPI001EAEB830|nr:protein ecdysoneless homolog isoform X2 [Oncorhynchus gorbuscha]